MPTLDDAYATYLRSADQLARHTGRFVLVHGERIVGYYDTYGDALDAGYEKFKLDPFLVKKIEAVERAMFFASPVLPCQP